MNAKLVTPDLGSLEDDSTEPIPPPPRPDLRVPVRRIEPPKVEALVQPGFVTEAPAPPEPTEPTEVLTIEVPRRLKRALLAEVGNRKDDPGRRSVASMKSVILEALAANGFGEFIAKTDIEVQAGIFMKRQAAQLRRRG
ncbi:MAG: hypothetical protein P4L90_10365 [Rhodopila sp.]|nr:hypothetical protein [Rhodopila sp.]